jgi:hypothetical protein
LKVRGVEVGAGLQVLHGIAWIAMHLQKPLAAKRTVDFVGRWMPRFRTVDDARAAANSLDRQGTCLSRALAVAARVEGGEVVIGVDARGDVIAHAWVEVEGRPLRAEDPRGGEIARLGARRPPSA